MESITCQTCEKVIEGYSATHVDYLMRQHQLTHERKLEKIKEKEVKE